MNIQSFEIKDDIAKSGIHPPDSIFFDGEIHRFGRKKSCWYVAHLHPVPVCVYGDWRLGLTYKYVHHSAQTLRPSEIVQVQKSIKALQEKQRLDKEREYKKASIKARKWWSEAKPAMFHEYLKRKKVLPLGIRVNQFNRLLIPLMTGEAIHSLQIIQPNGTKRFLKGGKTKGMYYPIRLVEQPEKLLICEGFSTGATLYMDTKTPVVLAFSANNLAPVARIMRKQYPDAAILICGDDDHSIEGNPGKQGAINAARACGGSWTIPDFTGLNPSAKDSDFNDLCRLRRQLSQEGEKWAS